MVSVHSGPDWLRPGMTTRHAGVYRVYHYAHRAPHEVYIPAETLVPACRRCGERVQFAPLLLAGLYDADNDLKSDSGRKAA